MPLFLLVPPDHPANTARRHIGSLLLAAGLLTTTAHAQSAALFAAPRLYTATSLFNQINSVAVADINGDGRPDIVTASEQPEVDVLLNTGGGTFGQAQSLATSTNQRFKGVAVADVTGDGKPDIVAASYQKFYIFPGNGNGLFAPFSTYPVGLNADLSALAVVDVNGDGRVDLLAVDDVAQAVQVLLSTGPGTFAAPVAYAAGTSNSAGGLAVADMNTDGYLDVLTVDFNRATVQVLLGTGTGGLGPAARYSTGVDSYPMSLRVGDVNEDGKPDVVVANSNFFSTSGGAAGILLGLGTGALAPVVTYPTGPPTKPTDLALADVDADGHLDILTANNTQSPFSYTVTLLRGSGTGTFQPLYFTSQPTTNVTSLVVTDVSGDHRADLVLVDRASYLSVQLGTVALATQAAVLPGQLGLWPNPASGADHVQLTVTELPATLTRLSATIWTPLGQLVASTSASVIQRAAGLELPTAGLVRGVYLVRLRGYDAHGTELGVLPIRQLVLD